MLRTKKEVISDFNKEAVKSAIFIRKRESVPF